MGYGTPFVPFCIAENVPSEWATGTLANPFLAVTK